MQRWDRLPMNLSHSQPSCGLMEVVAIIGLNPSTSSASTAEPPPTSELIDAEPRVAVVDASEAGFLPAVGLKSPRFKVGTLSCMIEDGAAGTARSDSLNRLAGGDSARSC